jgi:hypothetical protein
VTVLGLFDSLEFEKPVTIFSTTSSLSFVHLDVN